MTNPERLKELADLQEEFGNSDTDDERRKEILTRVQQFAEEEMPESRCQNCGRAGVYAAYDYALIPGHCYSMGGIIDYTRITRVCEYCFDSWFNDKDDEPQHEAEEDDHDDD